MPKKRFRESIAAAADRHRRKAGLLVPISAKKLATRCDFVQQREKKDLRKLHAVARLRKVRKNSGGFDSLHPLHYKSIFLIVDSQKWIGWCVRVSLH